MAKITKFTYKYGLYHITLGDTICHNVPLLAYHGKEMYINNESYEMYRMTGSMSVAKTVNNKITLDTTYFEDAVEFDSIKDIKKFLLELTPTNVYQDHIKNQFIKTLKLWKEPQTV